MKLNEAVDVIIKFVRVNLSSILSFFFGAIFVLCFVKTDKWSDAISAIANTVMAFAAIMGLVFARKWKRDATKDKVIEKCVNIMTSVIPDIKRVFVPTIHVKISEVFLKNIKERKSTDFKLARELRNSLKSYNVIMGKGSESINLFNADLKYVKALSWKVNESIAQDLDNYRKILSSIISKQFELLTYVTVIVSYWNLYVVDGDDSKAYDNLSWDMSNNDYVDKSLILCSEIIRLKEDLNTLIERMAIEEMSIFDVFEPK
ncbi:hypothetical protein POW08_06145 [Enterobacter kobei]|uniref:hypothetical protein n=1 Tax=Enterobacter kobei TaxID=208224 RepID=UPI002FF6C04D